MVRRDKERLGSSDQLVGGRGAEIDGSRAPRQRVGDAGNGLCGQAGVAGGAAGCRHRSEPAGPVGLERHVCLPGLAHRHLREIQIDGMVGAGQARVGYAGAHGNTHHQIEHRTGVLRRAGDERGRAHGAHATAGERDTAGREGAGESETGDPQKTVRGYRIRAAVGYANSSRLRRGIGELAAEAVVSQSVESGDSDCADRLSDGALRAQVQERDFAHEIPSLQRGVAAVVELKGLPGRGGGH